MAKKEYTIKLILDDTLPKGQPSRTRMPVGVYDPREFIVEINANDPKYPPLPTTAHELGHVLGRIFKTPSHMNDPRVGRSEEEAVFRSFYGLNTPDEAKRTYVSEAEAWDIGELMTPISAKTRNRSLDSYKE